MQMEFHSSAGLEVVQYDDDPEPVFSQSQPSKQPMYSSRAYHYQDHESQQPLTPYNRDIKNHSNRYNDVDAYKPPKPKKSRRKIWVIGIVLLILMAAAVGGAVAGVLRNKKSRSNLPTNMSSTNGSPSQTTSVSPTGPTPTSESICHNAVCTRMLNAITYGENMFVSGLGTDNEFLYLSTHADGWEKKWNVLGGIFSFPPAVISSGSDHIDILGIGTSNDMFEKHWDGSWSPQWGALGGVFATAPAIASWESGRLDVFGVGNDGTMYHRTSAVDNAWEAQKTFDRLDDQKFASGSGPAAVSWSKEMIDVIGVGTDNGIWWKTWDQKWSSWVPLNGSLMGTPVILSWPGASKKLDMFALGKDRAIWARSFRGGKWAEWQSLGGKFDSEPAAVVSDLNRIEIFATGSEDGGLWHKGLVGNTWGDWETLGGTCNSAPAAASSASRNVTVFCTGKDGMDYQALEGGVWSGWKNLAGAFAYRATG